MSALCKQTHPRLGHAWAPLIPSPPSPPTLPILSFQSLIFSLLRADVCNSCILFYFLLISRPASLSTISKDYCYTKLLATITGKSWWCISMGGSFSGENPLELTARYSWATVYSQSRCCLVLSSHSCEATSAPGRAYFKNANLYFKINLLQNRYARRKILLLKGLSYEIDLENVDENWQILAFTRAAAAFWIFQRHLWFLLK